MYIRRDLIYEHRSMRQDWQHVASTARHSCRDAFRERRVLSARNSNRSVNVARFDYKTRTHAPIAVRNGEYLARLAMRRAGAIIVSRYDLSSARRRIFFLQIPRIASTDARSFGTFEENHYPPTTSAVNVTIARRWLPVARAGGRSLSSDLLSRSSLYQLATSPRDFPRRTGVS